MIVKNENISPVPIDKDAFEQAVRIPPSQRLLDGPRLFDLATTFTKAGIRAQHPEADEHEILDLLRQRIALVQRMEQGH